MQKLEDSPSIIWIKIKITSEISQLYAHTCIQSPNKLKLNKREKYISAPNHLSFNQISIQFL